MSNWWDADPVASEQPAASGNWWERDPVAGNATSDVAKSAGSGLVKGAIGAAAAGPLAIDAISRGVEAAAKYIAPDSAFTKSLSEGRQQAEANRQAIQHALGPQFYEHTPTTVPGEYAQTAGEFLPSAVSGPGGVVGRLARTVPAALASETGGQVFKGTPLETSARIGGAIIGGGGSAVVAAPRTTERALASRLPDYVKPEHVDQAGALIKDAADRGITLTWPEALSNVTGKPVLTDMQRLLESSAETRGHMGNVLAPRPLQFDVAAQKEFGNLAPEPLMAPSMIGGQTQEAARGTLNDARRIINAHTEQFYDRAKTVKVAPEDMQTIQATPGYKELRDKIRNDPILNSRVANLPDDSVGFLDAVKKQYDEQAKNLTSKFNPQKSQSAAAQYTQGAQTVRDAAIKASPDYQIALNTQAQTRQQFLEPLLAGPLGKMAKTPETRRAIDALFPESPLPNSEGEVSTAVGALAKRNSWAASQLVRAHAEDAFNSASKMLVGGPNQFGAAGWAKAISGNPQQFANLKAAVGALPDGAARWDTFERFLNIARATGERQAIGSKTAFNTQDLAGMASGGKVMGLIKTAASPGECCQGTHRRMAGRPQYGFAR